MSQTSSSKKKNRFLLIRTDRIGDTILTLPSVSAIRKNFPKAFIAFLSRPYTQPLIEQYSGIDLLITYDPDGKHKGWSGIAKLCKELKEYNFHVAILFYPKLELAFAINRAKIPVRIGTGFRWYSFFFTKRIYEHRKECKKHESEYNLGLLAPLIPEWDKVPQFNFKHWNQTSWWEKFNAEIKFNDYVIVHPGSGNSAPNLSKKQYKLINQLLLEKTDWTILLTGISEEKQFIHDLAINFSEERVREAVDRFSLEDFFSVVRNASLLIASSTGPIHMANAAKIPVLGFFCPAKPHTPIRWGPYDQKEWAITPNLNWPDVCNSIDCPHGGCLKKLSDLEITEVLCEKRLKNLQIQTNAKKD